MLPYAVASGRSRHDPAFEHQGSNVGVCDCRTPRHKTHSTASAAEVAVAYAWHPWAGQLVRVHEVIERATGAWARCSPVGADIVRQREVPTWMLDASVCRVMWRVPRPGPEGAAPVARL